LKAPEPHTYLHDTFNHTFNHTFGLFESMAPQKKITVAEAHQWLKNLDQSRVRGLSSGDEKIWTEFINDLRPVDFKEPKKSKSLTSKKKSSTSSDISERSEEGYDCMRCDARASKKQKGLRFDFQCSHAKIEGECFCKNHLRQFTSGKGLELGKVTEDRPEFWASGKAIPWHDADQELLDSLKKKKKSNKNVEDPDAPKKSRKCSNCGEIGHTKRKCPLLNKEPESPKENTEEVVHEVMADMVDQISSEDHTDMRGFLGSEASNEDISNLHEIPTSALSDDTGLVPLQLDHDDSVTEDMSDDEDDSEEDDEDNTPFLYQGVQYEREPSGDQSVFDEEGDTVGNWDGEKIIFLSASLRKEHEKMVTALGGDLDSSPKPTEATDYLKMATKDLRKMAKAYGITTDDIDDADDTDDPKAALVKLIQNIE